MPRTLLFVVGVFCCCNLLPGQLLNSKKLVIIDSIPFTEYKDQSPIERGDIADITVITNPDSLRLSGREQVDTVTYIFTKAYRNRPDSIKRIPSREQMVSIIGFWYLNDKPYSGRYIDYYNNGQIRSEGTLLDGALNGGETDYFRNGVKKSVINYKKGIRNGTCNDYYKNGQLMEARQYKDGKLEKAIATYFVNGNVKDEIRLKKATLYDTSLSWHSNGKIRKMAVTKTGLFPDDKKQNQLDYYKSLFYQDLYTGDIESANKNFYEILLLDSTCNETQFEEGLLLYYEFRFEQAIAAFNKALQTEPFMMEALTYRALARIKNINIPI